jgi:hypothetical protein
MANKNIKEKALDALPYVAVAGVAIMGIYALTKLVKVVSEAGDFELDFGNDSGLSRFVGK